MKIDRSGSTEIIVPMPNAATYTIIIINRRDGSVGVGVFRSIVICEPRETVYCGIIVCFSRTKSCMFQT